MTSPDPYAQLLDDIAEGARLHYAPDPGDIDLALLRGDQLYARGLARLAELGDLAAIAELADVISLVAQAQAAGDLELAEAIWATGEVAVRQGADDPYLEAKALARAGSRDALLALSRVRRADAVLGA
jgi:hypothetical protein